ncbi:MAG: methyltransferase [Clostridia bacterium]|nr:methyltransferase [Clostridia bacterium]
MKEPMLLPGERLDDVNFRLRLIQKTAGLQFGTDALLLASYLKNAPNAIATELGGGSGIISLLALARNKVARVDCVEVQPIYAELIERNIVLNDFGDRMRAVCCNVRDVARQGGEQGRADVVFSNPPYMKQTSGAPNLTEEKNIARHEVLGDIGDFCAAAARLLRYGGYFYCVYRSDRMADLFAALRENRLEPKRLTFVHADISAPPSMLLLTAVLGGKSGMKVTRPLIIYQKGEAGAQTYTDDMQQVMECGMLPQTLDA